MRPINLSAAVLGGLTLLGAGASLAVYLLFKQDDDQESITFEKSKRQRLCIEVPIPKDKVGVLIGRAGKNIKDIQMQTDTKINFKDETNDATEKICVIRGLPENVHLAQAQILEFLASQPVILTTDVWVHQQVCGRIIGKQGSNIRAIQKSSGANVQIDSEGPPEAETRRVIIRGTEAQCKLAKSLIEEKVDEDKEIRLSMAHNARNPRSPSRQLCIAARGTDDISGLNNGSSHEEKLVTGSTEGLIEVYVSAMKNPSQFWIQKIGTPSVQLDRLVENMTEFYNQEENRDIFKPKELLEPKAMVATQFERDKKWYRAEVRRVNPDDYDINSSLVEVYYVDYGDDEVKTQSELCQLKIEFLDLRHQAIQCSLAGIAPISDDGVWSDEASDLFDGLSHASCWVPVMAKIQSYSNQDNGSSSVPTIDIISTQDNQDINIAEELVRQGFAKKLELNGDVKSSPQVVTCGMPAGEENWSDSSEYELQ